MANELATARRKGKKSYKFTKESKISIENLLQKLDSPEQVVGALKKKQGNHEP